MTDATNFDDIFSFFLRANEKLKVIHVATSGEDNKPNCAPKMLVDIEEPNQIYFIDYKFTQTHKNLLNNTTASISVMDEPNFLGYRLTGTCRFLKKGDSYDQAKQAWEKRLISYEADRIVRRVTGENSAREAENSLPENFEMILFEANEAAIVKPDRVLRTMNEES